MIPKYAGPWEEHEHGGGCECGYYPSASPFRGQWWARHDYRGDEMAIAWNDESKAREDAKLAAAGWILMGASDSE